MQPNHAEEAAIKESLAPYSVKPQIPTEDGPNHTDPRRALVIMGENFKPFHAGKATFHFGVDLSSERHVAGRVPWPSDVLSDCARNHVLVFVPKGLSIRRMAEVSPRFFSLKLDEVANAYPYLDWAPPQSRYSLLNLNPRRPYTARRGDEMEPSVTVHTLVYVMVLGLLAGGRQLLTDVNLTANDHEGCQVASVGYDGKKIRIGLPVGHIKMGLYERIAHLA